jgi:hypothetical protein
MSNLVEKWKAFCEWQRRPSHIPKKSPEWHRCHTCGEEYQGNYCPCCGQSAKIGRYSFKNALLLFLDVWGMGNRGMFRSLRDLVLRPGYMIRDYISGMQMAYFPPFKLLFLLTAFTLVVQSGINLKGENYLESDNEEVVKEPADSIAKNQADITFSEHLGRAQNMLMQGLRTFDEKNPALFWLLMLAMLSAPLYPLFRKSPAIPDLRFSELIITLVYTYDMFAIYNIIFSFFCIPDDIDAVIWLLPAIPLKQLSGFKWWRTILYLIFSYIAVFAILVGMVFAIAAVLYYV